MAHECGCHSGWAATRTDGRIEADEVVGDVTRRVPGALQVLKDLGINHCCGAHLTLTEAAAAAGVPLDTLVEALNARRDAPS
jgi:iron-sulfur cluster repair protein YtfE (RIC family)